MSSTLLAKDRPQNLSSFVPMCSHRAGKVCFKDGTIRYIKPASAGPGEIKRREVVLGPQVSPEEIKSREVELG